MSWPVLPGSVDVTITLIPKQGKDARVSKRGATFTVENCVASQVAWSAYNGAFNETEGDTIALNLPCTATAQPELHQGLGKGCEVVIADGQRLAGTYIASSNLVCSADEELGDSIQLVVKP